MVSEGKGRLFKRADDKYLVYLPKDLCEDSMFPWGGVTSVKVKVYFDHRAKKKRLIVEELEEDITEERKEE